jgi:hypothetical protein
VERGMGKQSFGLQEAYGIQAETLGGSEEEN